MIGITSTDEKVEWVKSLGFDYVINYKKDDLKKSLAEAAPNGIDCFFENVSTSLEGRNIMEYNYTYRLVVKQVRRL